MQSSSDKLYRLQPIVIAVLSVLLLGWLVLTPAGLLGKADAIGYAVCHRITARSFFIGDRALPLCARCSGMYLGALVGFLFQFRLGRRAGLPSRRVQAVLALFLLAFAFDGVNSYLTFFPQLPNLYPPQNDLRLLTGTLVGIGMAALLLPTFHQVVWQTFDDRPALRSFRQLGLLVGAAGLVAATLANQNPLLIYPLALLSVTALAVILTLAYALIWTLVLKKENTFATWKQLQPVILLALLTVLVQIIILDAGRFALTGTWSGFSF
jgi:uncharacterized membrane protein